MITALTIKKYITPVGGFTAFILAFSGNMSSFPPQGKEEMTQMVDHIFDWALGLDEKWGGLQMWQPIGKFWSSGMFYWYTGNEKDDAFQKQTAKLLNGPAKARFHLIFNCANWWTCNQPNRQRFDPIESWIVPYKLNGRMSLPSAILSRDVIGGAQFRTSLQSWFEECNGCGAVEIYQDLPHPNVTRHFQANSTSISPGFRNGMVHLISPDKSEKFTSLSETAYFSESAYHHAGDTWKQRYWGSNYDALLAVKTRYDPENLFWCKECVGSDRPCTIRENSDRKSPDLAIVV